MMTLHRLYWDFSALLAEKDLRKTFLHYFRYKWVPEQNFDIEA
jgi:hypothetical protein